MGHTCATPHDRAGSNGVLHQSLKRKRGSGDEASNHDGRAFVGVAKDQIRAWITGLDTRIVADTTEEQGDYPATPRVRSGRSLREPRLLGSRRGHGMMGAMPPGPAVDGRSPGDATDTARGAPEI